MSANGLLFLPHIAVFFWGITVSRENRIGGLYDFFGGIYNDGGANDEGSRGNVKGGRWEEGDRDVKERLPMTYVCRQSRVARLRNYWNTSCVRNK